jgi:hypothetical protein
VRIAALEAAIGTGMGTATATTMPPGDG